MAGERTVSAARGTFSGRGPGGARRLSAFTLLEMLAVIAVIGILVGFLFTVLPGVKRRQYITQARAEMGQLTAAIDNYHAAYGVYPPDNAKTANYLASARTNQLYYELEGTTNYDSAGTWYFGVLDDPSDRLTTNQLGTYFGVAGLLNSSKFNAGEDARPARNFLHGLRPDQTKTFNGVTLIVTAVGGPDADYQPLGVFGVNPWRYVSPGIHNPSSYDLWIQLVIGAKTNLICNWKQAVQINSPLP